MSLVLAFKAFLKAWNDPSKANEFVNGAPEPKLIPSMTEATHLRMLSALQQTARLVDFLKEDIKTYTDAQVGFAVRKIHEDCGKILEELVTIRTVIDEKEGETIKIPQGYDSSRIKLVGKVDGKGPFTGTVVHPGWIAHKRSLPKSGTSLNPDIISPAEVEVR